MSDHMELVEGNRGLWQWSVTPLMKAGDMPMQAAAMLSAPRPLLTNTTLRASASATSVR
jgi:hypothetical protein